MARRALAAAAALALAVVLAWLLLSRSEAPRAVALQAEPAPARVRAPEPPLPPPPAPSQHLLVRPAAAADAGRAPAPAVAAGTAPPPASPTTEAPAAAPSGPIDRRERPGPRAGSEREALAYAFETVDGDVTACLDEWRKLEPDAPAQVMLAFEIDGDGLQRSWLEHDGGLPLGPATCFANAVYGVDWSHIVDHPAKLTMRFSVGDGGR